MGREKEPGIRMKAVLERVMVGGWYVGVYGRMKVKLGGGGGLVLLSDRCYCGSEKYQSLLL